MNEQELDEYLKKNLRIEITTEYGSFGSGDYHTIKLVLKDKVISEDWIDIKDCD
jgi:hypothetical protein